MSAQRQAVAASTDFEKCVFVNCPYDSEFLPLLRPLLFTLILAGLTPRLALERSDSGELRFRKIVELIECSRYAIHDLSRVEATKVGEVFRLNMPFELGLDIGCRLFSDDHRTGKKCLILERDRYRYQAAISDLAGSDLGVHADEPEEIVAVVRNWVCGEAGCELPGPSGVWGGFLEFMADDYERLTANGYSNRDIQRLPVPELIANMSEWVASSN